MPRANKRADVAKERMIEAAERLFAQQGLETVSLRQIVGAAGFSNHFAVQYHFGDKAGLIQAIFERRLAEFEDKRAARLAAAEGQGRANDPRVLMEILYRPLAEQRDSEGRHSYAAFLMALQISEDGYRLRSEAEPLAPVTRRVMDRIAAAAPHVPRPLLGERIYSSSMMILSGLIRHDRGAGSGLPEDILIDDALDTATAAITAPVSAGLQTKVGTPVG